MSASPRKPGTLGHRRRWMLYIVGGGVWLSGGMWLVYHYFLVTHGEFGPTANPLEPWWLKLHGAFAFAAIWLFGLLWGIHITKLWPHKRRRWSGAFVTGVFALLIVSGYLLYYVGDDRVRPVISALHWIVGLLCPALFLWHRLQRNKPRSGEARRDTPRTALMEGGTRETQEKHESVAALRCPPSHMQQVGVDRNGVVRARPGS